MNFSPQDVVEYLRAAAGAMPLDKPGIYLVSEEDNDLVEKFWTGTELADQVFISSEVRTNSPAVYFLNEGQRCVFFLDVDNSLRCYGYDADSEVWEESQLSGGRPTAIHATSRLSGAITPTGRVLFFEDTSGGLQAIRVSDEGSCKGLPALPVESKLGAAHCAFVSDDDALHLVYVHKDGALHHTTTSIHGIRWTDTALPDLGDDDQDNILNFMIIPVSQKSFKTCVLTSTHKLVQIDEEGARTILGQSIGGKFDKASSEECVIEMMALISRGVKKISKTVKKKKAGKKK